MLKTIIAASITCLPALGIAGEPFKATNTYVTQTDVWPTGEKSGYWMVNFTGVSQVTTGPIKTMGVECNGAGFWGKTGMEGNGVCVHGSGDDTFILRWDVTPG